jgi:hypothetical protein
LVAIASFLTEESAIQMITMSVCILPVTSA